MTSRADEYVSVSIGVLFFMIGGGYLIYVGYRHGIVNKRIQQWGKWREGEDAQRLGIFAIVVGLACCVACFYWLVRWLNGSNPG